MFTIVLIVLFGKIFGGFTAPSRVVPQGRILGGSSSFLGEFPYLVSIQVAERDGAPFKPICGGVILSPRVILSVAHCTLSHSPMADATYRVVAGEHDLSQDEGTEQVRLVSVIAKHENFDAQTYQNDVALFFLEEPLTFNKYVGKARLPSPFARVKGLGVVAGWGVTEVEGTGPSKILKKLTIPFHPDSACEEIYGEGFDKHGMICAGSREGGKDTCSGDSGGPIVMTGTARASPVVIGLVSWGLGCGQKNTLGVYTKISSYIDWIRFGMQECSKIGSNICSGS